jgi:hypothetical protein
MHYDQHQSLHCSGFVDISTIPVKYAIHNMHQKSWKKLGYVPDSEDDSGSSDSEFEAVNAEPNSQTASPRELLTSHNQFAQDERSELDKAKSNVRLDIFEGRINTQCEYRPPSNWEPIPLACSTYQILRALLPFQM